MARKGGFAAKKARLEIEKQTGEKVVSAKNERHLQVQAKKLKSLAEENNQK
ncbi:MAG: hypothetical protein ABH836_01005 [Candidatus Omnitrophota bacterium]